VQGMNSAMPRRSCFCGACFHYCEPLFDCLPLLRHNVSEIIKRAYPLLYLKRRH